METKTFIKTSMLSLLVSAMLVGCGSSTSSTEELINFSGTAVDGYIANATVCLDTNINGVCDTTEPTTTTDANGDFSFDRVRIRRGTLYPIIASGGTDLATGNPFVGELKNIYDANDVRTGGLTVSPLTDLAATAFINSSTKDATTLTSLKTNIAKVLNLDLADIDGDPMTSANIFAKTQEIQQIKALIESSTTKATGALSENEAVQMRKDITASIMEQIQLDATNNSTSINIGETITKVETKTSVTIPTNETTFISSQMITIKEQLDIMANETDLSKLTEHQNSLEEKVALAKTNIENASESDEIVVVGFTDSENTSDNGNGSTTTPTTPTIASSTGGTTTTLDDNRPALGSRTNTSLIVQENAIYVGTGEYNSIIFKYDLNGTLDDTFGTAGILQNQDQFPNDSTAKESNTKMILHNNILYSLGVSGNFYFYSSFGRGDDLNIWATNLDGTPVDTFTADYDGYGGTPGLVSILSTLDGSGIFAGDIVIDNNVMYVSGFDNEMTIWAFNLDGTAHTEFGTAGVMRSDVFSIGATRAQQSDFYETTAKMKIKNSVIYVAAQSITAVNRYNSGNDYEYTIEEKIFAYNIDGTVHTEFGENGVVSVSTYKKGFTNATNTTYLDTTPSRVYDMIVTDDTVYTVGSVGIPYNTEKGTIHAYNLDGTPKTSFGTNGIVTQENATNYFNMFHSITTDSNGKLIVSGASMMNDWETSKVFINMYNNDGTPTTEFGTDGTVDIVPTTVTNVGFYTNTSVVVDSENTIYLNLVHDGSSYLWSIK